MIDAACGLLALVVCALAFAPDVVLPPLWRAVDRSLARRRARPLTET